ncbi:preprotein translocase subunit SecG [Lysobacter pythonis]|uniref:Protein-export membrane protein SecG n=1 Tax=Solilutibacter pythonis TaxID=2483112 RepID=A0A3M2I902_9GAMM|nr:preprotein translocase subunit SecG [Lysobacter pythonis]RMH94784.1 preprotein translocase subunit SecG [Lysobacter pythonis]
MLLWVINIFYVLVAIAMIALILMQRGAGAAAGSGFGGGASATVFGAQGSANFLSKSTKWLAVAFFGMTLGMAWMHMQNARGTQQRQSDLGVMGQTAPAAPGQNPSPAAPAIPSAPSVPAAPAQQAAPAENTRDAAKDSPQKP